MDARLVSAYRKRVSALRRGRLLTLAFSALIGGGIATLLAGLGILDRESRTLDILTRDGRLQAQTRTLDVELASLDRSLGTLVDHLLQTRSLAGEARDRLGLGGADAPEDVLDPQDMRDSQNVPAPWDCPGTLRLPTLPVEASLRQARALRSSFEEIVTAMQANPQVWAGLPSIQPLHDAQVTSGFGLRRDPFDGRLAWHQGIDFCAPTGAPILAAGAGRVVRAGASGDFGLLVEIDHGNGLRTLYGHTSRTAVKVGDWVERGDTVAYVGMTGRASAPHLHYEIHANGEPVNPEPYLLPGLWVAD